MLLDELLTKKDVIYQIATKYGAGNIHVFGSVARRENTSDSDIDLLVEFDENRDLFDMMDMKEELQSFLGHSVDVVTKNSLHRYIREQVVKEAVRL